MGEASTKVGDHLGSPRVLLFLHPHTPTVTPDHLVRLQGNSIIKVAL
ncbi:hypothetical protein PROFUN_06019 [Planoprotostelium fungivorum]|nr:hypothetical protein PROFUN_06019 [Planoprotostelium fungivorum]